MKRRSTGKLLTVLLMCLFSVGLPAQSGSNPAAKTKPKTLTAEQQLEQLRQQIGQQQQRMADQKGQIQQLQKQIQESNLQLQLQTQQLQSGIEQALKDLAARNLQFLELKNEVTQLQDRMGRPGE